MVAGYLPANPPARILRISPTAPPAPLSTAPKSGTTLSLTTPTFTWNAVPVTTAGGPFSYELQGDTSPAFTSPLDFSMAPTQDQLSFTPGSPLAVGRYYWRVRAINKFGVPGRWSALRVVTIRTTAPSLLLPADNLVQSSTRPTLYWYAFSTAKNYHIVLRQDNTCDTADPATLFDFQSTTTYLRLSLTSVLPDPLLQGDWHWCVAAQDQADNWTPYSPARTFSVNILSYPGDNLSLTLTKPTFIWLAVTGAKYRLQVADNSDFINPLVDVIDLTTNRYTLPDPINNGDGGYGTFFWRVQVRLR